MEPSRYDSETRDIMEQLKAKAVILAVLDGYKGNGCCMAVSEKNLDRETLAALAAGLQAIVDNIKTLK